MVRGPVVAHQPGPVDGEHDRQVLEPDVLHEHVEGALQKGRVDGDDRLQTAQGEPGREQDGVLLGDADVVNAARELAFELLQTRTGGHGRRDGDDALIRPRLAHDGVREPPESDSRPLVVQLPVAKLEGAIPGSRGTLFGGHSLCP